MLSGFFFLVPLAHFFKRESFRRAISSGVLTRPLAPIAAQFREQYLGGVWRELYEEKTVLHTPQVTIIFMLSS